MDGYSGIQFGQQGFVGKINYNGNVSSSQGVDVTQLQAGDTFKGEIASVNGEDVQILLTNGQYMSARLERDVQVALGQVLNLQVQSNKDNKVVLKPLYDNNAQLMRVGEAALRAANISVNAKSLNMVSNLLENGMSIDKNTLSTYNRLSLQNPNVDISTIIELNKLKVPVTQENVNQLQSYENMQHKLLDGVNETANEVIDLFEGLAENGESGVSQGVKFMEQVVELLGDEGEQPEAVNNELADKEALNSEALNNNGTVNNEAVNNKAVINSEVVNNSTLVTDNSKTEFANTLKGTDITVEQDITSDNITGDKKALPREISNEQVRAELTNTESGQIPAKIIKFIDDGKLDMKGVKQLLNDSNITDKLTEQQKSEIFKSEPFKTLVKSSFQDRWTLTPKDIAQEGKVEEFYEKLEKETSRLSKVMNEAINESGNEANLIQAKAASNMNSNIEFMNQVNHMMNYVQLPLKLSDSNAHGDLYVYTNKKHMAGNDGTLTAFLHLDMDNLGSLDVSISLQTDKNRVNTKFYLDEDSLSLVEEHKDELIERLSSKGYQCNAVMLEKEEDKTVIDHLEEQAAGHNAMISYQTFDTRA